MARKKLVLDADVIFHFSRVDRLSLLFCIFEDLDYVILSPVYEEVLTRDDKLKLDNFSRILRAFDIIDMDKVSSDIKREYIHLRSLFGKGESACMAFCKYSSDVVGSSNLRDIYRYCTENGICYLTSIDILSYGVIYGRITVNDANRLLEEMRSAGAKLPIVDFGSYKPREIK